MTYQQAKVILAFAESDMSIKATSGKTYYSYSMVRCHLRNVAKETGRDPQKFYDLCYLVGVATQVMEGRKSVTFR